MDGESQFSDRKSDLIPSGRPKEHFIPLRKSALTQLLTDSIDEPVRTRFCSLCQMLEATIHYEYHAQLEHLCDAYHAFNPDSDRLASTTSDKGATDFFPRLRQLAERANFFPVSRDEMRTAAELATAWGVVLKVDFEQFDDLEVFARGDAMGAATRRDWRTWFRTVELQVPTYRRLLMAFRLRDSEHDTIYIKLFKNIPHGDVEKLLPGGKLSMTWFDHARVFAPTATGLAIMLYKISKGALLLAFAGVYGLLAFIGLVGGTIGYGLRSFFGYLQAKDKYRLNLTENLYFQNLDNNAGVIFRLLYDAEEQEFCEAALAYFVLWRNKEEASLTMQQLDERAEATLAEYDCGHVDFEVSDAIDKLLRWGLVARNDEGLYQSAPIDEALANLDSAWDGYFHHPASCDTQEPG